MSHYINLCEYLSRQPSEKKFVAVSFFITNPETSSKLKAQWSLRNNKHSKVFGRNLNETQAVTHKYFDGQSPSFKGS